MVSSGEPQVCLVLPSFVEHVSHRRKRCCHWGMRREGSDRKVSGYTHGLKPRGGCWPSHLHKGQKPWGWG